MKKEEDMLKKYGKGNPFKVPENYFENFTEELMGRLPEKEAVQEEPAKVTVWSRVRPWIYMAAMFTGMLVGIRFMVESTTSPRNDTVIAAVTSENEAEEYDQYIDGIMENYLIDDYTLYAYLTDTDTDFN